VRSTPNTDKPAAADKLPDLSDSPLYLLAVLFSARRSKDRVLERVTRRQLDTLGIRITFGSELSRPKKAKGERRG
jgi:hypothetical protein